MIKTLIDSSESKEEKRQLHVNYNKLKEEFFKYVNTLSETEIQALMEKVIRGENKLGMILRNEPQPKTYISPHPSIVFNPSLLTLAVDTGNINLLKLLLSQIQVSDDNLLSLVELALENNLFAITNLLFTRLTQETSVGKYMIDSGINNQDVTSSCYFLKDFDDPRIDISHYFSSDNDSLGQYRQSLFSLALMESIKRGQLERAQSLFSCPMFVQLKDEVKKEAFIAFIERLIKSSEEKLSLPEKINYDLIKYTVLEYVNSLKAEERQTFLKTIDDPNNTLGNILRKEQQRPLAYTFTHSTILQQLQEKITRIENPNTNLSHQRR